MHKTMCHFLNNKFLSYLILSYLILSYHFFWAHEQWAVLSFVSLSVFCQKECANSRSRQWLRSLEFLFSLCISRKINVCKNVLVQSFLGNFSRPFPDLRGWEDQRHNEKSFSVAKGRTQRTVQLSYQKATATSSHWMTMISQISQLYWMIALGKGR